MKILVRLPNWLGDMVMSLGFLNALQQLHPGAGISVIAKKGIHGLLEFFPPLDHQFIFSKEEYPGIQGAWQFGRMIRKKEAFDLFFCLPDSFSSALMGYASGAKKRIGYKNELRQLLLTNACEKQTSGHRVYQYLGLLSAISQKNIIPQDILLHVNSGLKRNRILININSEATSRRLPVQKAVSVIKTLQRRSSAELLLIGGKADVEYVNEVMKLLPETHNIINHSGKTSLSSLVKEMAASKVVLTTDSGPAHVANALGVRTVVLFGAGNERNTAPFNEKNRTVIRLGKLPCEPCVKNKCLLYGLPKCLELLDEELIVSEVLKGA